MPETTKPANPPAFPEHHAVPDFFGGVSLATRTPGMTLRDHFAAKAMPELIAYKLRLLDHDCGYTGNYADSVAFSAYAFADAMLKVREAK